MKNISTLIVGAGQAGLAMSRELTLRSEPHVLIERGEVANSWAHERWDSLRLLTPNWQSRLPGHGYTGPDPDGFMDMAAVVEMLTGYAARISAPVESRTKVTAVTASSDGYRVETDRGAWACRNLVVASGSCNRANIPAFAAALPDHIRQLSPLDYRTPAQLAAGGVLVVGASASGVQIAAELADAGRNVVLSAGHHVRMPRHYRGRDIQWWMDRSGLLATTTAEVDDLARARAVPSLQARGRCRPAVSRPQRSAGGRRRGGRTSRRFPRRHGPVLGWPRQCRGAVGSQDEPGAGRVRRLGRDRRACRPAGAGAVRTDRVPPAPRLGLDLRKGRIVTVIWATGFRPEMGWLQLPVFDRKGRLAHRDGIVAPGLTVLGLPFLRSRKSSLIDGVGADAAALADQLVHANRRQAA
ncbi:MAG: NAD(P)-binding domain-containing protein [Paracoccaceae bacterium]